MSADKTQDYEPAPRPAGDGSGADREQRLDEVIAAYLRAVQSGQAPDPQEWLNRHPDLAAELAEFFADRGHLERLAGPVRAAVTGGAQAGRKVRYLGDYELLEELGRGGMGVVYKARQNKLNRLVALKMILAGEHAGPQELARFRSEAKAVARLQHPNIVQIYAVGQHQGHPYFSLEFCPGGSLDRKLQGKPLLPREAALLLKTLARAVQAAHQAGVIHRDLKPQNVLLAADGTPKITDFGLAKKLDSEPEVSTSGLTPTGAILGTPSYMAPEQAQGQSKEIGPAADVYALGAILYECLTGRPPFRAATAWDTVVQVVSQEPVAVRQVRPGVPRDLETICHKCLDKEPGRRYATAEQLAEDLEDYLEGKPIRARPVGRAERLWLWCRRKPVIAGLGAAAAVLLVLTGLLALFGHYKTKEAAQAVALVGQGQKQLIETKDLARKEKGKREEVEKAAERQEAASAYLADMPRVAKLLEAGDLARARALLGQHRPRPGWPDQRAWEWYFLSAQCRAEGFKLRAHPGPVLAVAWSPDDARIASAGQEGTVKIWDVASSRETRQMRAPAGSVGALAWSPDGKQLAGAGPNGTVQLWETATGKETVTLQTTQPINPIVTPAMLFLGSWNKSLHWRADGHKLALAAEDGVLRIWDTATGKETFVRRAHLNGVHCAAWSPDGRQLASVGGDGLVKVWDAVTGEEALTLRELVPSNPADSTTATFALAWSADGKRLTGVCSNGVLKEWDAASGAVTSTRKLAERQSLEPLVPFGASGYRFIWSPDGKRLASLTRFGMRSSEVKTWDPSTGKEQASLLAPPPVLAGLPGAGCAPAWSGNDQLLALGGSDGMIQALPAGPRRPPVRSLVQGGLAWSMDSRHVFGTPDWSKNWEISGQPRPDWTIQVCDAITGELTRKFGSDPVTALALRESPDGRWLACTTWTGLLQLWDLRTGKEAAALEEPPWAVVSAAWGPDGKRLAIQRENRKVHDWDVATGEVQVWDVTTGEETLSLRTQDDSSFKLAWSPDGKRLAGHVPRPSSLWRVPSVLGTLWESTSGREIFAWRRSGNPAPGGAGRPTLPTPVGFGAPPQFQPWRGSGNPPPVVGIGRPALPTPVGAGALPPLQLPSQPGQLLQPPPPLPPQPSTRRANLARLGQLLQPPPPLPPAEPPRECAWSPDCRYFAVTGRSSDKGKEGMEQVEVWDATTGKVASVLRPSPPAPGTMDVACLEWSPDSKRLGVGTKEFMIAWDVSTGRQLLALNFPWPRPGSINSVGWLSWSPDGRRLAGGPFEGFPVIKVGDLTTRKEAFRLTKQWFGPGGFAWSPDGRRCASCDLQPVPGGQPAPRLRVWEAATGKEVLAMPVSVDSPTLGWSPDGKRLAARFRLYNGPTNSWLEPVTVWDVAAGRELFTLKPDQGTVSWSPDGSRLACSTPSAQVIYDAATGKEVFHFGGRSRIERRSRLPAMWSPSGRYVASAQEDRTMQVWDAIAGKQVLSLGRSVGQKDVAGPPLPPNKPPDNPVLVAWSPDGKRLASSAKLEANIRLWDPATRKSVRTLPGHGKPLRSLAWSPDGRHLASAGLDGKVKVWDPNSGKEVLELPFFLKEESGDGILAWSPDGKRLAVAGDDGSVKVWEVPAGKEITTLHGLEGKLFAVAWSPDGKRLASASADGPVLLWDTATWQMLLTLKGGGGSLAWSPDGWQLGSFSGLGAVKIWDATPE